MKQLAKWAFEKPTDSADESLTMAKGTIASWLTAKGRHVAEDNVLIMLDGRQADVCPSETGCDAGCIIRSVLTEPTSTELFRTDIRFVVTEDTLAVCVELAADSDRFTPLSLDVRRPNLVKNLLCPPSDWAYHGTLLSSEPRNFDAASGGDDFIEFAWDPARSVPVVAVSDDHGAVLHPGVVEDLASDLAGLAIVARLDADASWRVTNELGREWSCYGGAIRLYWPDLNVQSSPFEHPLWTPQRLLRDTADTRAAADAIRKQLRRRILGLSAFAINESPLFDQVQEAARESERQALISRARDENDYKQMAEDFYADACLASDEIKTLKQENKDLRGKIYQLTQQSMRSDADSGEIKPVTDVPPATVQEAVDQARRLYASELTFGTAVDDGIQDLAADAGPPDKIFDYLRILAEATKALRNGPLGQNLLQWLKGKGADASGESATNRNSTEAQQARTWDDGVGGKRVFDSHLKPSSGTSPDRCVRIFFEYDQTLEMMLIGWVGRHP